MTLFLNSKISHFWIRLNCPELQGGTRELSKVFFEKIPIIKNLDIFNDLNIASIPTAEQESQINQLIYTFYNLTPKQINHIESKFTNLSSPSDSDLPPPEDEE